MDANTVNAVLADNGGALTINKADGGTWILNGANTFTGGINTANGGLLGIGAGWSTISASAPNPLGMNTTTNGVILSNAGLFTLNPTGLTINSGVALANNSSDSIAGQYSMTLNQFSVVGGGNNWVLSNTLPQSSTLTIGGATIAWTGTATVGQTLTIQGTGNTVFNAALPAANATFGFTLSVNTTGTVTLNASSANTGGATLNEGTLVVNAKTPFGTSASISTGVFTWNGGNLVPTLNLTAANSNSQIVNPLVIANSFDVLSGTNSIEFAGSVTNSGGNRLLTNNLSGGASLIFSNSTVALSLSEFNSGNTTGRTFFLGGSGNTLISGPIWNENNAGINNILNGTNNMGSTLEYQGSGTLTLTANNPYTLATILGGGTTILSGNGAFGFNSTTALNTASITSQSLVLTSVAGLGVGEPITGPGIASGTTITAISGTTLTLSQFATVPAPTPPLASAAPMESRSIRARR